METIGDRLKFIRNDFELNQIEFSKRIGVTNAHISRMEKGITIPSEALIKLICKEFDVNEEWLKTGSGPIYIGELQLYTDALLINSTKLFGKLLSSQNENIRYRAARLDLLFAEITNVGDLEDKNTIIFLDLLIDLFTTIQNYNTPIKERLCNRQLIFDEILSIFFEQYKSNISQNIDNFKKNLEEITHK